MIQQSTIQPIYHTHKPAFAMKLETPSSPRAMSRPFPVPHPRGLSGAAVSLFWEGDRGYKEGSTYSFLSVPKPMRIAITSARTKFDCVGWMKIPSGFDLERGRVVDRMVCSETGVGIY